MKDNTRPVPAWWRRSVVYQINLRTFTPEGTLKAAEARLAHVASIGVDFVYLCPVVLADDDMNEDNWSKRQKASCTGNPKNSYRISDYFAIDPEYGDEADLDFNDNDYYHDKTDLNHYKADNKAVGTALNGGGGDAWCVGLVY